MDSAYMQDMAYIDSQLKAEREDIDKLLKEMQLLTKSREKINKQLKDLNEKVDKLTIIQRETLDAIHKYNKRVKEILNG
jgi:septal ring factor EnvC (AmiA/AmiB activator)